MQRLSPSLFLGFLVNSITGEHFIAAAEAANPTEATAKLRETYPSAAYQVLTVYQAQAVVNYLGEVQRWPGLPSKVQPSLPDLLATQRIRTQVGGLPPLRKDATPNNSMFNAAQVQQIKTIAKGMPLETQALAARLLTGSVQKPQAVATPAHAAPTPATVTRQPIVPTPTPAPLAARVEVSTTPAPKGSTIKEALATMRAFNNSGQPSVFSQTMPKAPAAVAPMVPPTSALPASARGVATESTPAPSPLAVGQVSAISVLKALRAAR